MTKKAPNTNGDGVQVVHFAFPNAQDIPTKATEFSEVLLISFFVTTELRLPIFRPRFGKPSVYTSAMLMPKTSADFDDFSSGGKN
jgi:hypothetical protein